jgi:tetratricopeptide (TPR) repeat protein
MNLSNTLPNKLILFLLLLTFTSGLFAKTSYSKSIYDAFIVRDMTKWETVVQSMEASHSVTTVDQKLELVSYYYGVIGYLIGKKQYLHAEQLTNKGEALIDQVLKASPKNVTATSYKGSFTGFRVGIKKFKALLLIFDSKKYINKAVEMDPQNVQALIDKGNMYYYAPAIFGGDKKTAINYYLKAAGIMEQKDETSDNWVYLNTLTMIAFAYTKTDNPNAAKQMYTKIMRLEPNITWAKEVLIVR